MLFHDSVVPLQEVMQYCMETLLGFLLPYGVIIGSYVHPAENPQDVLSQTHPQRETHPGDHHQLRTVLAAIPHHKHGAGVCLSIKYSISQM